MLIDLARGAPTTERVVHRAPVNHGHGPSQLSRPVRDLMEIINETVQQMTSNLEPQTYQCDFLAQLLELNVLDATSVRL